MFSSKAYCHDIIYVFSYQHQNPAVIMPLKGLLYLSEVSLNIIIEMAWNDLLLDPTLKNNGLIFSIS